MNQVLLQSEAFFMALCNVQDLYVKTGFILRSLVKLRDYLLDVQNGSTKPVLEDVKTL